MKQLFFILLFLYSNIYAIAQINCFGDHFKYKDIAINDSLYHIFGTSPIIGNDGKVHLFAARWSIRMPFDIGWRAIGEICHYVGNSPEGPFDFVSVVAKGTGLDTWDKCGLCNPTVHKVDDKYILLYTSNNNYSQPHHPKNQMIGMLIADNLYGPWKRVGKNGCILKPSSDPKHWTYNSWNGVNNPAFIQHPNGEYLLYFKSSINGKATYGVASSKKIEGPYIMYPKPVTNNSMVIEDGYAFIYDEKICLLTTDNHGIIEKGGGILWKSDDGIQFNEKERGYYLFKRYLNVDEYKNERHIYGNMRKLERPQILMIEGKPTYMYAPSGTNIKGERHIVPYIFEFK